MNPFEKVNTLLDRMETLIDEEEFDIDNKECSALNNEIIAEFNKLEPLWVDKPVFLGTKKRFEKLWDTYEPIEEDLQSIRDMMFPDGVDDD